jgi:hypothetical protein
MTNKSVVSVIVLTLITFGIYGLYWEVKTKGEMNKLGANIPTAWLLIVPFANFYWIWVYSQGVEKVTNNKLQAPVAFLLLWLVSIVGIAIIQNEFNSLPPTSPVGTVPPVTPIVPTTPTVPTVPTNPVGPAV